VAGVSPRTAWRWRQQDPEFDEAVEDARQGYYDSLEEDLQKRGGVVGKIVLLKKGRPAEFIERRLEASISLQTSAQVTNEEAKALLAQMLGAATPATLQALNEAGPRVPLPEAGSP
jgi:hypothetical protein